MAKRHPKKWWIKKRFNPQLGIYYVAMGRLSNTAAKKWNRCRYGENVMLPYDTEEAYKQAIENYNVTAAAR